MRLRRRGSDATVGAGGPAPTAHAWGGVVGGDAPTVVIKATRAGELAHAEVRQVA